FHAGGFLGAAPFLPRPDGGRGGPFPPLRGLGNRGLPGRTFLVKALPLDGAASLPVMFAVDAVMVAVASRSRRHPLSALAWIMGFTAVVLMVDVATGARLQVNSVLGYSPQTAARFFGIGNSAFAILA